jgi:hypothetical protein
MLSFRQAFAALPAGHKEGAHKEVAHKERAARKDRPQVSQVF